MSEMRFLTGDDTGILKWVRVEAQKVEKFGGPRRRGDAVERLCWAGPAGEELRETRVAVGYASGAVEAREVASGAVLGSFNLGANIRCLSPIDNDLLAVSKDGAGSIVANWCAEDFPSAGSEGGDGSRSKESREGAAEDAEEAAQEGAGHGNTEEQEDGPDMRRFKLLAPVTAACLDPLGSKRLAFGGGENDVKIFDVARGEVTWKAKNMPENYLCLRIPIKLSSLQWATEMAPSRSLLLVGTTDGKVRLYDVNAQRRPLFELQIGHKSGQGTGGYTGTGDDLARPVNCSMVAKTHDGSWSIFMGNTMGVLREYDLRKLSSCQACPIKPGRKSHLDWAAKQLPLRRGYRGIMGAVRDIDVHSSGSVLAAVGLGRFAFVFETKRKKMISKVYLKQKLCSVLLSSEAYSNTKGAGSDDEDDGDITGEEREDRRSAEDQGEGPEVVADDVQEGFSSDEGEGGEGGDEDGTGDGAEEGEGEDEEDTAAAEAAAALAKRRQPKRKKGTPKAKAAGRKKARKASA